MVVAQAAGLAVARPAVVLVAQRVLRCCWLLLLQQQQLLLLLQRDFWAQVWPARSNDKVDTETLHFSKFCKQLVSRKLSLLTRHLNICSPSSPGVSYYCPNHQGLASRISSSFIALNHLARTCLQYVGAMSMSTNLPLTHIFAHL